MRKFEGEERAQRIMDEIEKGQYVSNRDMEFLAKFLSGPRKRIWPGVDLPNGLQRAKIKLGVKEKLEKRGHRVNK